MHNIHPQILVNSVILAGPKLVPTYRKNSTIYSKIQGAEVPRIKTKDTTFLIFSNYICDLRVHLPFLLATKDVPTDTPEGAYELQMSTWAEGSTANELQWAIEMIKEKNADFKKIRTQCIRKTYDSAVHNFEIFPVTQNGKQIVTYLSNIFMLGSIIIKNAIGEIDVKVPSLTSTRRELRKNPKYSTIKMAVMNARALAFNRKVQIESKFRTTDALQFIDGSYILPTSCPVLGIPLDYNQSNSIGAVRVWRKNVNKGLVTDNVTIMSALALRMIEGVKISKTTVDNIICKIPTIPAYWLKWKETHVTNGKI